MIRYRLIIIIVAGILASCSKGESPKDTAGTVKQGIASERTSISKDKGQSEAKGADVKLINWDAPPMPDGAEGTFVAAADVVFIRSEPNAVLPHEKMSIRELDNEYNAGDKKQPFPQHLFYGENITGIRNKDYPDVVKTPKGYIDIKKLWHEPHLEKLTSDRWMTVRNTKAYLIPDRKSPEVISLFQGEVLGILGQLEYAGGSWIKASFCNEIYKYEAERLQIRYESREFPQCNRYGYIESSSLESLYKDKIDQSLLTTAEIPETMRKSDLKFSEKDRDLLAGNGFYIEPLPPARSISVDDMVDQYHDLSSASFITSDLLLHTFHLVFDRMLQDIEEKKLFPSIQSLTNKLLNETKKEIKSAKDKDQKVQKALLHNLFFFSVASKLFDPQFSVPQEVRSEVSAVVERIIKADGQLPSLGNKIDLGDEDFTQYRVRGHYQKKSLKKMDQESGKEFVETDDRLERYFRGMMWYGRHSLLISDDIKTLAAILMVRALENSGGIKDWERLDGVLTRVVGKTDDWGPGDYEAVNLAIFGKKVPSLDDVVKGGEKAIKDFRSKAFQILPKQKIVSMPTGGGTHKERIDITSGFKFLGQRFTWDAYIFNQLTSPSVGSDDNLRNLPESVDIMTILGSKAAEELSGDKKKWANYESQVEMLKKEMAWKIEKKDTIYNSWLGSFKPLFSPTRSRQRFAVQSPWQFKQLNSALASWTELKHDTILYSEQSYAEAGEGDSFNVPPYEPPYLKGYVEPNPAFFSRLLEMVTALRKDLKGGFLTDEYDDKLQTFETLLDRALKIAEKEIDGSEITRDDYAWIEQMSRSFDRSFILPREIGDIIEPDYLKMALIADVATDAASGLVLKTAIGVPQRMIAVVKDYYGGTRLTVGYVYSWFEFADRKRWTDDEWKKMVYGSGSRVNEMKPSWYSRFQKK